MVDIYWGWIVSLLAGHLLGDFLLQTRRSVESKERLETGPFAVHGAVQALLAYVLCGAWVEWRIPAFVLVSHTAVDALKVGGLRLVRRGRPAGSAPPTGWALGLFFFDQALHVAALAGLAFYLWCVRDPSPSAHWVEWLGLPWVRSLVVLCGALVAVRAGTPVIATTLSGLPPSVEPASDRASVGRVVGQSERLLLFLALLPGYGVSAALVLVAKAVVSAVSGLDSTREEWSRMVAGTFLSFAWGGTAALATRQVLALLPGAS